MEQKNETGRGSATRLTYTRPQLSVFGSVRNLTGGSLGSNGDTMSTFMAMM